MDEEADGEPEISPEQMVNELPQHPDTRRQIRIKYRTLLNDVSSKRSELLSGNTVVLKEKIDDTNQIFQNVKHPREAALDAQCCSSIANLGKQKAQALSTGYGSFSITEFAEKLITCVGRRVDDEDEGGSRSPAVSREDWIRLGSASQTYFRRSPTLHYIYGMLDREEKVRTKIVRTEKLEEERKEQLKAAVKPKETDKNAQSEEVTTREVENVLVILRETYKANNRSPICYFEFVTNPVSFSQTIENVFYTSFLIRDGFARIFLDDDGLPVIEPVVGRAADNDQDSDDDDDGDCHQMVMAWTLKDWKGVIESFQITKPIIPTRAPSKQPTTADPRSALASSVTQINGVASGAEHARASTSGVHSHRRSSRAGPSALLDTAQATPSGVSKSASRLSQSSASASTSSSAIRSAARRTWNFVEDSDDDDA